MNKLERLKNVVVIVDEHTAASNIISQFKRLGFTSKIIGHPFADDVIGIWSDFICAGKIPQYSTIFATHEIITYNELVDLVDDYLNDLNKKEDPFEMVDRFLQYYSPSKGEDERKALIYHFKKHIGYELEIHNPSMSELIEAYARVNDIGVDQVRVKSKPFKCYESNR